MKRIRMNKICMSFNILCLLMTFSVSQAQASQTCDINIGVSLHPYYSWVKNIVGDTANVSTLIPEGADPHTYQPMPADLQSLQNLDVLIMNGLGHDSFVAPMLKATDVKDLQVIETRKGLPLIPSYASHYDFEDDDKKVAYNSHTYLGLTIAVMQIQRIAEELGKRCPEQADLFKKNSRTYTKKLRKLLAGALKKMDTIDTTSLRIATVHDGYAYLFQELGIEVSAVVQPRHGIEPSARQLQDTIKRIKKAKVNILFTELDYEKRYVDIIFQETGCRVYSLSHVSVGVYSPDLFEKDMVGNLEVIEQALVEAKGTK